MKILYIFLSLLLSYSWLANSSFSPGSEIANAFRNASVTLRPIPRTSLCSATHILKIKGTQGALGDQSLTVATHVIPHIKYPLILDLADNNLQDDFSQIGLLVAKNPNIKGLDLSRNPFETCRSLYSSYLHEQLETLVFQNNSLTSYGVSCLFNNWGKTSLKNIDISDNPLKDFWFLKEGLKGENLISRINISNTGLTPTSIRTFAEELKSHRHLTYLNLSNNTVGGQGALILRNALKGHPSLKILNLEGTLIDDPGAKALIPLLSNSELEHLDLSNNPISAQSASPLIDSLRLSPHNRKKKIRFSFPLNPSH